MAEKMGSTATGEARLAPLRERLRHAWQVPLAVLLFCAYVAYLTTTFERVPKALVQGVQPADFPLLLIGVILLLTAVLVWQLIHNPDPPRSRLPATFFVTVGLFLAFASIAAWVDLFAGFAVFAVGLSLAWGERRPVPILAIAVVLPLAIFLLFDLVLEIRFPRGVLTSLYYD